MAKLYSFPYSQHARRIISLLEETDINYEVVPVDMMSGQHMAPDFLALNPNHQVPVWLDDDVTLFESNAIMRYLCNRYDLTDWYPTDKADRAKVDQWLDWNQCQLSPLVVGIVLNRVFLREMGDAAAADQADQQLPNVIAVLENALRDGAFLCGETPSIADLSVASNLFQLGFADRLPDTDNIRHWYEKVSSLRGFQASLPPTDIS